MNGATVDDLEHFHPSPRWCKLRPSLTTSTCASTRIPFICKPPRSLWNINQSNRRSRSTENLKTQQSQQNIPRLKPTLALLTSSSARPPASAHRILGTAVEPDDYPRSLQDYNLVGSSLGWGEYFLQEHGSSSPASWRRPHCRRETSSDQHLFARGQSSKV